MFCRMSRAFILGYEGWSLYAGKLPGKLVPTNPCSCDNCVVSMGFLEVEPVSLRSWGFSLFCVLELCLQGFSQLWTYNTAYYMWLILEVDAIVWQVVVVVFPSGLVSGWERWGTFSSFTFAHCNLKVTKSGKYIVLWIPGAVVSGH